MTKIIKEGKTYIWEFVCNYCGCEFQTDSRDKDISTNIIDTDSLLFKYGIDVPKDVIYDDPRQVGRLCTRVAPKAVEASFMSCPWCSRSCVSISRREDEEDDDIHDA